MTGSTTIFYFCSHIYTSLRDKLTQTKLLQQEKLSICQELTKLNVSLTEVEMKHHVTQRWEKADSEYIKMQEYFSAEKLKYIAEALWAASSRRQFLLNMKVKYAEGQKIAKKTIFTNNKRDEKVKGICPRI